MTVDPAAFEKTLNSTCAALKAARNTRGFWEGELSSSALSTATALFALHLANQAARYANSELQQVVQGGLDWLCANQNADGGWGDTVRSFSNISTTALCWAAITAATDDVRFKATENRAEQW